MMMTINSVVFYGDWLSTKAKILCDIGVEGEPIRGCMTV